jgi:hypothetical protein
VHLVSRGRRIAAPFALAAALFAVGAGSAHASLLVADGGNCRDYTYSQVFLPWADPANYTLAPGGDFERSNRHWQLLGASRVADNEAFGVGGIRDRMGLSLPDGAVAISQPMCVGLGEPTMRMFFKQTGGTPIARLRVDVLFDDVTGATQSQSIGWVGAMSTWSPSQQIAIVANLLPLLDTGTPVAFRFTAVAGDFTIDDVYVDPWNKP